MEEQGISEPFGDDCRYLDFGIISEKCVRVEFVADRRLRTGFVAIYAQTVTKCAEADVSSLPVRVVRSPKEVNGFEVRYVEANHDEDNCGRERRQEATCRWPPTHIRRVIIRMS